MDLKGKLKMRVLKIKFENWNFKELFENWSFENYLRIIVLKIIWKLEFWKLFENWSFENYLKMRVLKIRVLKFEDLKII